MGATQQTSFEPWYTVRLYLQYHNEIDSRRETFYENEMFMTVAYNSGRSCPQRIKIFKDKEEALSLLKSFTQDDADYYEQSAKKVIYYVREHQENGYKDIAKSTFTPVTLEQRLTEAEEYNPNLPKTITY